MPLQSARKRKAYRVENWKQGPSQIFVIRRLLQSLVLSQLGLGFFCPFTAALDLFDLFSAESLAFQDQVIEVELLENGSDDVHLNHVAREVGLVRISLRGLDGERFAGDEVSLVHDALLRLRDVVVEENLEGLVVSLVYDQRLSVNRIFLVSSPGLMVVRDAHRTRLEISEG